MTDAITAEPAAGLEASLRLRLRLILLILCTPIISVSNAAIQDSIFEIASIIASPVRIVLPPAAATFPGSAGIIRSIRTVQ